MDEIEVLESNDDFSFFVPFLEVKKANMVLQIVEAYLSTTRYYCYAGYPCWTETSQFTRFSFKFKEPMPRGLRQTMKTVLIEAIALRR